jgi:hypothetical protein
MKIFTLDALFEWAKEWIFGPEVRDCLAAKDFSGCSTTMPLQFIGPPAYDNPGAIGAAT